MKLMERLERILRKKRLEEDPLNSTLTYSNIIKKKEDEFEIKFKNTIKRFYAEIKYRSPPCFGFRYAFPDGDSICNQCPLYVITEEIKKEINQYTEFVQKKYKLSLEDAKEEGERRYSCRYVSEKRNSNHYLLKKKTIEDIKQRFSDYQDIRIKNAILLLELKFQKENEEAKEGRKKKIEELWKGG